MVYFDYPQPIVPMGIPQIATSRAICEPMMFDYLTTGLVLCYNDSEEDKERRKNG